MFPILREQIIILARQPKRDVISGIFNISPSVFVFVPRRNVLVLFVSRLYSRRVGTM